mmetsp:Transcript_71324/g.133408  ORF Transcript_71324/g.133408 Transcript_71324/m.133408 type:complete len:245 (+) Transcript_71324:111-845(+)
MAVSNDVKPMRNYRGMPIFETMQTNLVVALQNSTNPKRAKEALKGYCPTDQLNILRDGWEGFVARQNETAVNVGVISALILSVTLPMAGSPPNYGNDDHEGFVDWFVLASTLASSFSIAGIIFSLSWLNWVKMGFVIDIDDANYLSAKFGPGLLLVTLVLSVVPLCAAIQLLICIVVEDETKLQVTFWVNLAVLILLALYFKFGTTRIGQRRQQADKEWKAICDAVFESVVVAEDGSVNVESST